MREYINKSKKSQLPLRERDLRNIKNKIEK